MFYRYLFLYLRYLFLFLSLYVFFSGLYRREASTGILTFKRRIKSHLPFAGIISSSPYSTRFQDKG